MSVGLDISIGFVAGHEEPTGPTKLGRDPSCAGGRWELYTEETGRQKEAVACVFLWKREAGRGRGWGSDRQKARDEGPTKALSPRYGGGHHVDGIPGHE